MSKISCASCKVIVENLSEEQKAHFMTNYYVVHRACNDRKCPVSELYDYSVKHYSLKSPVFQKRLSDVIDGGRVAPAVTSEEMELIKSNLTAKFGIDIKPTVHNTGATPPPPPRGSFTQTPNHILSGGITYKPDYDNPQGTPTNPHMNHVPTQASAVISPEDIATLIQSIATMTRMMSDMSIQLSQMRARDEQRDRDVDFLFAERGNNHEKDIEYWREEISHRDALAKIKQQAPPMRVDEDYEEIRCPHCGFGCRYQEELNAHLVRDHTAVSDSIGSPARFTRSNKNG